ncbi:MAG: fused MFS/spermidine synthase [Anaerolineales bacterium]|nr:fused MFS/spermidine synthase [Anaerolineales bacterium]MCW5856165.1 fused MFS/spermidine synthase [Anaerolineales bacterium]
MSPRFLAFSVFSAGMTTLAVEFTASRLLGNVFGTSNLVWASIIGLMLIYLTIGYFIGGRWADRAPHLDLFYRIILWGAFTSGLAALAARPVLRLAADAFDHLQLGVLAGSFASVLILFIVPISLLGMVSPFAIRLSLDNKEQAGQTAGRLYAISTIGSFVGTFLPVLVVIPLVGSTYTFLIFSFYLMAVALAGLWQAGGARLAARWVWLPLLLAALSAIWAGGAFKNTPGQVYEAESAYNYIQVLEFNGTRYLRLNEGQGVHSVYNPEQLDFRGTWEQFLVAPFFNPDAEPHAVGRIAVVGLAAGTSALQASEVFGPVPIDGFEIDPKLIEVGRQLFGMTMPNLNAIAADGRMGLRNSPHSYDLIQVDAYRPPYIPPHLTTVEFFSLCREKLSEHGVLTINVGRTPSDRRLVDALVATLSQVFASVHVMDVPNSFNSIVYATVQPTSFDDLQANYIRLHGEPGVHPLLLTVIERALVNRQQTPTGGLVLTDERAPVEWIVNSMVLNFFTSDGVEDLQ